MKTAPVDNTPCVVAVLNRDGTTSQVSMTLHSFHASKARFNSFAQDTFLGQLVSINGEAVKADEDAPF